MADQKLKIKGTVVFEKLDRSRSSYVALVGGARSSKSYSIGQWILMKLIKESRKKFLITRKTLPSLKATSYKLLVDMMSDYGIYNGDWHNKTDRVYSFNGNYVLFTSVDDPQKIKSTEFNYIWMEEADEFTWEDFIMLRTRLSGAVGKGEQNRLIMSLNPSNPYGWVKGKLEGAENVEFIFSNYLDNPFLSVDYVKELEELKGIDPEYWKIYGEGKWAMPTGLIYTNWRIGEVFPSSFDEEFYGLDFGYNNPTALIKAGVRDGDIYLTELLYQTKLTNADLISFLESASGRRREIYADSAEPQRIEEIYRAGFNIKPAEKEVFDGIDFLKRQKLICSRDSTEMIREFRGYKWKADKNGKILDEPVKFNDHLMDAVRYAVYTHLRKGGRGIEIASKRRRESSKMLEKY